MHREIEFKAMKINTNIYTHGSLIKLEMYSGSGKDGFTKKCDQYFIHHPEGYRAQVDHTTIGEFTGITCKIEEKEFRIFENDIFIGTIKLTSEGDRTTECAANIIFKDGAFYANVINLQGELLLLLSDFITLIIKGKFIEPGYKTKKS